MIKLPVFKERKCYLLYNNYVCWGRAASQTPPPPRLACKKVFSESLINSDFLLLG